MQAGYRGVDTASIYENEVEVGRAIADSGVPRDQIFVQTKLWRSFAGLNPKTGKPKCKPEVAKSLRKLGLERIDLWLMHWRVLGLRPTKLLHSLVWMKIWSRRTP